VSRTFHLKSSETGLTISDLVTKDARQALAEDAEDLAAFRERAAEPILRFEQVLKEMKKRGLL
jgi:hypothetical protein